jgi:hypothetical protein
LVPSRGTTGRGASYSFVDRGASATIERYWLVAERRDGSFSGWQVKVTR